MKDNAQNLLLLRKAVEESINHKIETSSDFTYLAGVIQGRLKENLSSSTLKRLWGYIDGYKSIRDSTLDILARLIGYPDYETFVCDYCMGDAVRSSVRIFTEPVYAKDIPVGTSVEIQWNPGRIAIIKHMGNGNFEVISSVNSKIKPGDTFVCHTFYLNQPLFLENLVQGKQPACNFVIGNKGGLTVIKLL